MALSRPFREDRRLLNLQVPAVTVYRVQSFCFDGVFYWPGFKAKTQNDPYCMLYSYSCVPYFMLFFVLLNPFFVVVSVYVIHSRPRHRMSRILSYTVIAVYRISCSSLCFWNRCFRFMSLIQGRVTTAHPITLVPKHIGWHPLRRYPPSGLCSGFSFPNRF